MHIIQLLFYWNVAFLFSFLFLFFFPFPFPLCVCVGTHAEDFCGKLFILLWCKLDFLLLSKVSVNLQA